MKKGLLKFILSILFFLVATFSFAQQKQGDIEEMAQKRAVKLQRVLDLDAYQQEQVFQFAITEAEAMQTLKQNSTGLNRSQIDFQIQTIHDQFNENMKVILSDGQYQKFEQMMKKQKAQQKPSKGKNNN